MEALLVQKKQGKLSQSALEHWVRKFEDEYEVYYKDSSEEKQENLSDIEAQFEALHKEVEDEYATRKFNTSIPQHTPLDSSIAKDKVRLSRKKSFSSNKNKAEPCNSKENRKDNLGNQKKEELEKVKSYPPGRNPFEEDSSQVSSPRTGKKGVSSNTARDAQHTKKEKSPFRKDDVKPTHQTKDKNSFNHKYEEYFPITRLTDEEKSKLLERKSKTLSEVTTDQNEYEDVRVFKKRTKKKKKKDFDEKGIAEIHDKPFAVTKPICNDEQHNKEKKVEKISPKMITVKENVVKSLQSEQKSKLDKDEKSRGNEKVEDEVKGSKKPFESFQNCMFTTFTACVPWCLMKQVYWRKDKTSEELFSITARRNSRTRVKMKYRESIEAKGDMEEK